MLTKWFRDQLSYLDMTQKDLARHLEIDPSSVSLMFQGKRKMSMKEANQMAKLFGVDLWVVLEAAGLNVTEAPQAVTATLRGIVKDELKVSWLTGPDATGVAVEGVQGLGWECLRFETAQTPWDGLDGALALYRPGEEQIDPGAIGRLSVVRVKGDGVGRVRVVRRGYDRGRSITNRFNLFSVNGEAMEQGVELDSAWGIQGIRF